MARQHPPLVQRFLDKFSKSRDLSISLVIHVIIVVFFGAFVVIKVVPPPQEIQGELLQHAPVALKPVDPIPNPSDALKDMPTDPTKTVSVPIPMGPSSIIGGSPDFAPMGGDAPVPMPMPMSAEVVKPAGATPQIDSTRMSAEQAKAIRRFADWGPKGKSGTKSPMFEFTAYIGQYAGGNWNSTVRVSDGKIETGSLPNLLYLMSYWTKDRVVTNYKNVKAIRLDSDEIFAVKPPFIFLTGTKDFVLTEKEVENARKYISMGGCIWGDSSVPGERSRFDVAFRREMGRVMGTADQKFEPLPENHAIFSKGYFSEVKGVAKGLNNYRLPVYAMKYFGEVAIIYTANDYGDMWQVGLDAKGQIDGRKDLNGNYVAVNRNIYNQRDVYVRNLSPEALATSYKFGANIVMHLLTRWENRVGSSAL